MADKEDLPSQNGTSDHVVPKCSLRGKTQQFPQPYWLPASLLSETFIDSASLKCLWAPPARKDGKAHWRPPETVQGPKQG